MLPVVNKRPAANPITIHNPNGTIMYSTHTAELDIPHLPPAACQVHIVPDLASHTLLSIGQLCDAGCDVTFNANAVTVTYQNHLILQVTRTATTRLWHFIITAVLFSGPFQAVGTHGKHEYILLQAQQDVWC
jgi:hypothetical protein